MSRPSTTEELRCVISDLTTQCQDLDRQKNGAYSERNQLVKFLSKCFPSSIERHDGEDWEDDWRNVVFIDLPTGQASWHIHDSELANFEHLPRNRGRKWDGHSTELKYQRLDDLWVHDVRAMDYQETKAAQAGRLEAGYTIRQREATK
jgi:hypothetical protein